MLLAVPNFSEGRDPVVVEELVRAASGGGGEVLDVHADLDHNRCVLTIAGAPGSLGPAVAAAAAVAVRRIDMRGHDGVHPCVGAIDVAPVVHRREAERGPACAEALVLADLLAQTLELPVLLYGALAGGRTRAELRRGGLAGLAGRLAAGELRPDFGPESPHPTAGATLVAARPPLVALNVELAPPCSLPQAQAIAARIREGGAEGLAGVRAIGLWLEHAGVAQVSMNVEDPGRTPLRDVVAAIRRHGAIGGAELVGLAPAEAFAGFPDDVAVRNLRTIEEVLRR